MIEFTLPMETRVKQLICSAFVVIFLNAPISAQVERVFDSRAVLIKGDNFEMGIGEEEIPELMRTFKVIRPELFREASPKHRVTIDDYYIDKTEVTNAAFKKFVEKNAEWGKDKIAPSAHNGKYLQVWNGNNFPHGQENFPVVYVTWHAAVAYCRSVGMRLPTEAEWEYAARGGLKGAKFPWGNQLPNKARLNYGQSGFDRAIEVGRYAPNGFGLHDMAGNVWEFIADEWQLYRDGVATNPVAGGDLFEKGDSYLAVTTRRVLRGGSYGAGDLNLFVAYRDSHDPGNAGDHVGFRCAASRSIR